MYQVRFVQSGTENAGTNNEWEMSFPSWDAMNDYMQNRKDETVPVMAYITQDGNYVGCGRMGNGTVDV